MIAFSNMKLILLNHSIFLPINQLPVSNRRDAKFVWTEHLLPIHSFLYNVEIRHPTRVLKKHRCFGTQMIYSKMNTCVSMWINQYELSRKNSFKLPEIVDFRNIATFQQPLIDKTYIKYFTSILGCIDFFHNFKM